MHHPISNASHLLAVIGLLVLTGWVWALSNVGMPDAVWLANAALTLAFVVLVVVVGIQRMRRG